MGPLEQKIIERIRNEGPISFESFMDMALYWPELGYYANPKTVIGRKGDFYTSPHLHPAFGAMMAESLTEMWTLLGRPSPFHAVEMGAGMGYLCKDILEHLHNGIGTIGPGAEAAALLASLNYVIVEPYCHFEDRQREVTGEFAKSIAWIRSLGDIGSRITGCVFSNELPDAFPVRLVTMDDELKEIFVTCEGEKLSEIVLPPGSPAINGYIQEFGITLSGGYRTEINLRMKDWIRDISSVLENGFLLTIDYGYSASDYYSEERSKGTLLCYNGHQVNEDPYRDIGMQDITAHVNFSAMKKWGLEAGLRTIGYCPQGTFLAAAGIDRIIAELFEDSPDYLSEAAKIKGLLFPQGMGTSHSVMVQYKGDGSPDLKGFSIRNSADRL